MAYMLAILNVPLSMSVAIKPRVYVSRETRGCRDAYNAKREEDFFSFINKKKKIPLLSIRPPYHRVFWYPI